MRFRQPPRAPAHERVQCRDQIFCAVVSYHGSLTHWPLYLVCGREDTACLPRRNTRESQVQQNNVRFLTTEIYSRTGTSGKFAETPPAGLESRIQCRGAYHWRSRDGDAYLAAGAWADGRRLFLKLCLVQNRTIIIPLVNIINIDNQLTSRTADDRRNQYIRESTQRECGM